MGLKVGFGTVQRWPYFTVQPLKKVKDCAFFFPRCLCVCHAPSFLFFPLDLICLVFDVPRIEWGKGIADVI